MNAFKKTTLITTIPLAPLRPQNVSLFPTDLSYDFPQNRPHEYFVLDFETTGLRGDAEIIEMCCARVFKGIVTDIYDTLVKPSGSIDYTASKLTGITAQTLEDAPSIQEAGEGLAKFLGVVKRPIFAHNASFEARFLFTSGIAEIIAPDDPLCCTIELTKRAFPGLTSYSLAALTQDLKLQNIDAHRARGDVLCTAQLVERCYDKIEGKIEHIEQLDLPLIPTHPPCPRCHSTLVAKDGFTQAGTQMYRCKECSKKFH